MIVRVLLVAIVVLFLVMWFRAAIDAWQRPDLSKSAKSAWMIGMLVLPFAGLLVYMMLRPTDAQLRRS